MKAIVPLLAAVGLFSVGGCATTSNGSGPLAQNDIDYQKVYLVEQWAKRNGASVFWINYPKKPASAAQ